MSGLPEALLIVPEGDPLRDEALQVMRGKRKNIRPAGSWILAIGAVLRQGRRAINDVALPCAPALREFCRQFFPLLAGQRRASVRVLSLNHPLQNVTLSTGYLYLRTTKVFYVMVTSQENC